MAKKLTLTKESKEALRLKLPLMEIGPTGLTRIQVQNFYDNQRRLGLSIRDALRGTEFALNVHNVQTNASGKTITYFEEQTQLQEAGSNLRQRGQFENVLYLVKKPFDVWLYSHSVPSNAYYGSAQLHRPEYVKKTLKAGDVVADLAGGLYATFGGGRVGYKVRMSDYDFAPFERRDDYQTFPLDKLERIDPKDAKNIRFSQDGIKGK